MPREHLALQSLEWLSLCKLSLLRLSLLSVPELAPSTHCMSIYMADTRVLVSAREPSFSSGSLVKHDAAADILPQSTFRFMSNSLVLLPSKIYGSRRKENVTRVNYLLMS